MNTSDNNRIIAEFMGIDTHRFGYSSYMDWAELMPVIDKIESKGFWTETFGGQENGIKIGKNNNINAFIQSFGENRIETYYDCILKFIKWFNEQPETIEL